MKKFLIIGNGNAVTYKEIFPLIKDNKMWLGASKGMGGNMTFYLDEELYDASKQTTSKKENGKYCIEVMLSTWFTNIKCNKKNPPLTLTKTYNAEEYPKYGNFDCLEVSKVKDIPMDYYGIMGVPISFLDKYCPEQFEIIGCANAKLLPQGWKGMTKEFIELFNSYTKPSNIGKLKEGWWFPYYITDDGKPMIPYSRILIRRKL